MDSEAIRPEHRAWFEILWRHFLGLSAEELETWVLTIPDMFLMGSFGQGGPPY